MEYKTIALIAAMPEEIKPLLRRVGSYTRKELGEFPACRFAIGMREIRLIESGMGPERSVAATRALIATAKPDLIIDFGFCGSVITGTAAGDIVVAERVLSFSGGTFQQREGLTAGLTDDAIELLVENCRDKPFQVSAGTFITAAEITGKRELVGLLPPGIGNPVLEMETAAVAQAAAEGNVPLLALRAVSDGAGEELGFTIEEFTDREMNVRVGKVLLTVARKPWIVPQLLRLARNAKIAGENLATAMLVLLENL
jgi:adenosylhomocysteine nucleosidase